MLRLTELALLAAPLIVFLIWLRMANRGGPPPRLLAASFAGLAVLASALIWFGMERAFAPGSVYVPAAIVDGRIVPGHAAAPAPGPGQ